MTTSVGRNSSSTATPTKATFSYWLKGQHDGTQQGIWGWHRGNDASNYWLGVYYSTNGSMYFNWKQSGLSVTLGTTQKFRDPCAWGHHVISIDTTLGTASDRVKWYINGQRVTSFEDGLDTISQNTTILNWSNSQDKMEIGTWYQASSAKNLNNHLISHFHMTDAYAYQASDFGSTDNVTGEWSINTSPSVTYGSEGGFWFKDDASLTDRSGQGNNFILDGGTLTKTEDNPSNNFSVINFNFNPDPSNGSLGANANGGLSFTTNITSQSIMGVTTIGATSGKYYAEFKLTGESGAARSFAGIGYNIYDQATTSLNADNNFMWNVCSNGVSNQGGSAQPSGNWSNLYTTNDIISVAMDLDNNKVYFAKNGQYADGSGNWDEAFTGSPAYATITADKTYFFCAGDIASSTNSSWTCNFGNGYFATTAISSEGTNASGIGKFEYDVPSGFTALSTKGLNE